MKLDDYIIDPSGFDWDSLLSKWRWLLPKELGVLCANNFGDLFMEAADGSVHRLDIGSGSMDKLCESRDEFWEKIRDASNAEDWLMIPIADRLVAAGKLLKEGECYSYRMLPILGGSYGPDNFIIKDLAFYYAAFGPIHEKIKDLPDGTQIKIEIKD